MLTREIVQRTYAETHGGRKMDEENLSAFLWFCGGFDAMDSESYQEAHERICASMDILSADMADCGTEQEQMTLVHERLGWMKRGEERT